MWSYFERMLELLREVPAYGGLDGARLLEAVLFQPKYIWMRRRNHVEQAVSWAIACQTGIWSQKSDEKSLSNATPKFDFKVIDEWCNRIKAHDKAWESYFHQNQIEPLVIFYEDVVASHRAIVERVLKFLELEFTPGVEISRPTVEKQATRISKEWVTRYLELKGGRNGRFARSVRRLRF